MICQPSLLIVRRFDLLSTRVQLNGIENPKTTVLIRVQKLIKTEMGFTTETKNGGGGGGSGGE